MRIIFAGTPEFAAHALRRLQKEHEVVAVLTQPDRPKGRGMRLQPSPVKQLALEYGLKILQPSSLKSEDIQRELRELTPEVMVVAAYGLILPKTVLEIPKFGCLNIHASLLPRWRGAAPIQRAILAGDNETGITIMQMDEGLDTGDILLKQACEIVVSDTAQTLHDKLAELGAHSVSQALKNLKEGVLSPEPQDNARATYAAKLNKAEARLDWKKSATELEREVRAYQPSPVSFTMFGNEAVKVFSMTVSREMEAGEAGKIIAAGKTGIEVQCAEGSVILHTLQRPGGKPMTAEQFLQSYSVVVGEILN